MNEERQKLFKEIKENLDSILDSKLKSLAM